MNEIKNIIATLTVSFIVYGVVMLFSPSGEMGKSFKTVVGIALIFTIVFCLFNIDFDIDFKSPEVTENTVSKIDSDSLVIESAEHSLEKYIISQLNSKGLSNIKVSVFMDISSDRSISIKSVEVKCNSDQFSKVDDYLKGLGIPYNLTVVQDE